MTIEKYGFEEGDDRLTNGHGMINWPAVGKHAERLEALRQKLLEGSDLPADATLEEIRADIDRRCGAEQSPPWFNFRTGERRR